MSKKELCWNITSKCNQNCIYCFREQNATDCSAAESMGILQYLISRGIKELTWSGGEPLLYQGLDILLQTSYEHKIINKLNTNGALLTPERLQKIAEYIDMFTLSLDTVDSTINAKLGRGATHQEQVLAVVKHIKDCYPNKKVTINVVINKFNLNSIPELVTRLNELPIDGVRLFQVSPIRGRAIDTFSNTAVTTEQFEQAKAYFQQHLKHANLTFRNKSSLESKYLVITPNGNLCYNSNGKDILIKQLRGKNR